MGFFKLGKMTMGSLFKKPETTCYPFEKKEAPDQLKGQVQNHVKDCILCGICMKRCPCEAITVDKAQRTWSINHYQCITCGYCIRECPKKCLFMNPDHAPAASQKAPHVFEVPEKEK